MPTFRAPTTRLAAMLLATATALAACGGTTTGHSTSGGSNASLTIGVAYVPTTWDPYKNDYGAQATIQQAVYDTLIRRESDGTFKPDLASSFKYDNPTTFEMTIRSDVKFADGTALTADVVKQNLERAKSVSGPKTDQLSDISSIDVSGDVVTVHLGTANPALPIYFSQVMGMMVSPKGLADQGALATSPSGAGPYVLVPGKTVANSVYTFSRNPNYFDKASFPYDNLVVKVIADPTAGLNAVRSGQVDLIAGTTANAGAAKSAGLNVVSEPGDFRGIWFNDVTGATVKPLGDARVRKAIELAIDRPALVSVIGAGKPTVQIFPPGTYGYDAALDTQYAQPDDAGAKALLAQAGYPDGFSLPVVSTALFDPEAQSIAASLAKVGVNVKINEQPLQSFGAAAIKSPAFITTYAPTDTFYDARSLLLPKGGFNFGHHSDDQVTKLVGDLATATTDSQRTAIGQQLSQRVVELGWYAVGYLGTNFTFVAKKIAATPTPGEAAIAIWNIKPSS